MSEDGDRNVMTFEESKILARSSNARSEILYV